MPLCSLSRHCNEICVYLPQPLMYECDISLGAVLTYPSTTSYCIHHCSVWSLNVYQWMWTHIGHPISHPEWWAVGAFYEDFEKVNWTITALHCNSIIPHHQHHFTRWSGLQEIDLGHIHCVHSTICIDTGYYIDGIMQGYHISIANAAQAIW